MNLEDYFKRLNRLAEQQRQRIDQKRDKSNGNKFSLGWPTPVKLTADA